MDESERLAKIKTHDKVLFHVRNKSIMYQLMDARLPHGLIRKMVERKAERQT